MCRRRCSFVVLLFFFKNRWWLAVCWLCNRRYTNGHYSPYNLAGCPGLQFTEADEFGVGKRIGYRILCGAGIVVGVPLAVALAVPVLAVGGSIYGIKKLHKYRQRQLRMRRRW